MKKNIRVAVAGLGEFGRQIVPWIQSGKMEGIEVLYCVEPDNLRGAQTVGALGLPFYPSLVEVPEYLRAGTDVIVDCAPKGQGAANLELYRQLGFPAVFQNGEAASLCDLFYAPLTLAYNLSSPYLKIARCSALTTCAVVRPLMDITNIESIWACHFKVNGRDCMLEMNYASGPEITMLLGIPARVDVVYLRGVSYNGYAYHGTVHLNCTTSLSKHTVLKALARNPEIIMVHEDIDTFSYPRGTQTLVIEEGVEISGTTIRIAVLSFTPEINFPQNEAAIRLLKESA